MLRSITIAGLGLDETVPLDPLEPVTITRPSTCGKTRIGRALVLLWTGKESWGSSPDTRDGEPISIVANTSTLVIGRKITRGARGALSHARKLTKNGDSIDVSTEKKWQAALARLCSVGKGAEGNHGAPDVARLVMWPLVWQDHLGQGGRPLRDLLLTCLDTTKAVREIVEKAPCYREGDPTDEKGATAARAVAKKNAATAEGKHDGAVSALERLQPVIAPESADVDRARALLGRQTAWDTFGAYMDRYDAWIAWGERRQGLGDEPGMVAEETIAAARVAASDAATAAQRACAEVDAGEALVREARRKVSQAESAVKRMGEPPVVTDDCPTCKQPWEDAHETTSAARDEHDDRAEKLQEVYSQANTVLSGAEVGLSAAVVRSHHADDAEQAASNERERIEAEASEHDSWSRAITAMGKEPVEPSPVIEQPAGVPPKDDVLAAARDIIEADTRAQGASSLRDDDRKSQELAVETARKRASDKGEEVARLEDLVVAIREAPAQLLPYAIEQLGDCGPVRVVADGAGLRVMVNGHPWQEASTGELIHADLLFRVAIRRAFRVRWLPIVVDRVQDWSGEWPVVAGPVYYLRTSGGAS